MSEKGFRVRFEQEDGGGEIVNEKGVELTAREVVDQLNHFVDLKYDYSYSELLKELDELKAEDKRLCNIISNLHNDMGDCEEKIEKQQMIINIQWDIITSLMKLKGVME